MFQTQRGFAQLVGDILIIVVKSVWEGTLTNSTLLQRVNSMCEVLLLSELLDIPDKGSTRYASERILDTGLWVLVEVELGLNMVNGLIRSFLGIDCRHCLTIY